MVDSELRTRTSTWILEGLADPGNRTVWNEYVGRYRPVVVGYLRKLGVAREDAEDVAQSALMAFCDAYRRGKYDREKGRLSSWLFGIVRRQLLAHRRVRAAAPILLDHDTDGDDLISRLEAPDETAAVWRDEWRAGVLRQCFEEVRSEVEERTLAAFEAFAIRGEPAAEVAARLEMTENAIYGAKRRVLERIQEIRARIEEIW